MNRILASSGRLFPQTAWKNLSEHTRGALIPLYLLLGVFILVYASLLILREFTQPGYTNPLGFTWNNPILEILIPYLLGWVYLGSGIWVFLIRHDETAGRVYGYLATTVAISLAAMLSTIIAGQLTWLWIVTLAIAGGSLLHLGLYFPTKVTLLSKYPTLFWLGYIPPILIVSIFVPQILASSTPGYILPTVILSELGYICLIGAVFITIQISALRRPQTSLAHRQARISLWGALITGISIAGWAVTRAFAPTSDILGLFYILLVFFPILASYALLLTNKTRHDTYLRKTLAYTLLSALTILAYILIVSGMSILVGDVIPNNHPLVIGLLVFLLAILMNPVRHWLESTIDIAFYKGEKPFQKRLQAFAQELTRNTTPDSIYNSLRKSVRETLAPGLIHIFIIDPFNNHYIATADESGLSTSDMRFPPNSPFVQFLVNQPNPLLIDSNDLGQLSFSSESAQLALLGASLYIPLPGQQQLVGWLAIGNRQSGESYHKSEIVYLDSICSQAALAIERLQVITNLESRVREMDVLTRIAQGVNITLDFDDILELIYAQTNLVIPVHDFRITLSDPNDGKYSYAFFIENDERLAYNENITIPPRQGLEGVVIQNQRSLIASDYQNECRSHGRIPNSPGIVAWLGVPLHAGSRTIGCISLGSRDPATLFTEHLRDLLQAIADQAAGAIIKSQLLVESDRRARQLAALNEVGRSLTSTLEINTLLKQILNSAVELLNCEAGSLYTIEPETNDIVVEVTIGPGASDIAGTHIPARSGFIGSVMESGQPVIVNTGTGTQDFSDQTESQSEYYQRDLLAVPMKVKETVIGAIEVINKLDGTPFDEDDQGILSTFSSQAAVAIENARLYTQTDEALSARLEEMSVMQRIDRELNTSLDVGKTMQITLDWSLRQTKSDSGFIGFVERDEQASSSSIRVIASKGFKLPQSNEHQPAVSTNEQAELMTVSLPAIQKVIREGLPVRSVDARLSPWARAQIVIPIRRKTDVIGILLLESTVKDSYSPDTTLFLTRLSDHAAIAISNAQLYEDLQAANIAKSEFVSLVSHELKTPMTSIRGYADLLAQGTVGPINEIQGNFLNTIRSNVNRMANLVSDLADVSRIEAGKLRLEFGEVSITEIIHEVINSTQAFLNEKEQVLVLDLPENSPLVWADYNRLIQILNNLVSNAIKYTPQGGHITITAGMHQNEWDSKGAPQVVKLSVIDTGYGISAEEQTRIFQKFFRSSDPNIRDVPGTGLGLNITRHLVEMQGGRIWFSSQAGMGTTFHFTIPVAVTI